MLHRINRHLALHVLGFLLLAALPLRSFATVTVTAGTTPSTYVLTGDIATPAGLLDGKLVVQGDVITCVAADCETPPDATVIRVSKAYILPGFIDAHNHVAYNVFPKWVPPKLYGNRYQWQDSKSYKAFKAPYNELKAHVYCEMVKYGEVKALISGITTIQGTSPNQTCFKTLIRNVENQNELALPASYIRTNILPIDGFDGPVDWTKTHAFVVHIAEGIDEKSRAEFDTLKSKHLLNANTAVIHGTAFGQPEFHEMAAIGAKLIWSPQSNLVLYGQTTNIQLALAEGVKVSLGVDWNPSGSDSIFDELRVARTVNEEQFDGAIADDAWLNMITANPAEALAVQDRIGSLAAGRKADITVVTQRDADVNLSLLSNRIQDVQLVMVGGRPLYGNRAALDRLRPGECEPLTVRGSSKRVCVSDPTSTVPKAAQTLADIRAVLLARYALLAPLAP